MKKLRFDILSTKKCAYIGCTKFLKQRLVNDKPTATLCYGHHKKVEITKGHFIDHQPRKARVNAGMPVKSYR